MGYGEPKTANKKQRESVPMWAQGQTAARTAPRYCEEGNSSAYNTFGVYRVTRKSHGTGCARKGGVELVLAQWETLCKDEGEMANSPTMKRGRKKRNKEGRKQLDSAQNSAGAYTWWILPNSRWLLEQDFTHNQKDGEWPGPATQHSWLSAL